MSMPFRGARFYEGPRALDSVYAEVNTMHRALGWEPLTDLREGLERSMAFYRDYRREYWGDLGCSR